MLCDQGQIDVGVLITQAYTRSFLFHFLCTLSNHFSIYLQVAVNTSITDLSEFLDYIIASTNMKCLTLRGIESESGFLAANLYATSTFGEDALVNVSAEKGPDGNLSGTENEEDPFTVPTKYIKDHRLQQRNEQRDPHRTKPITPNESSDTVLPLSTFRFDSSGYIRIRSKTQGIALSLGDKITLKQAQKAPK